MKRVFGVAALLLLISSCSFHKLEYKGGECFKFDNFEGKEVSFTAGAKISNQNDFAIKVNPSDLKLFIEGEYMGLVHLDDELRIKRKSEEYVEGSFIAVLADGAIFRAMRFINKSQLKIRLKGTVKAKVLIFGKKIEVNEIRTISGSDLKLW